jgi:hypothetical protein
MEEAERRRLGFNPCALIGGLSLASTVLLFATIGLDILLFLPMAFVENIYGPIK